MQKYTHKNMHLLLSIDKHAAAGWGDAGRKTIKCTVVAVEHVKR